MIESFTKPKLKEQPQSIHCNLQEHQLGIRKKAMNEMKEIILANADRKIRERRAWLHPRHFESRYFGVLKADQFFYMFSPVMPCFWTFEKEPASDVIHDGPKWLCGLQELHAIRQQPPQSNYFHDQETPMAKEDSNNKHYTYENNPCIVYSVGSRNEFTFERRVRKLAPGCEIHTFDPTAVETGDGKDAYNVYHGDIGLGGKDMVKSPRIRFPTKSLLTIMKELNHTHVDYLKIDVEGYEWDVLNLVQWNTTKVGQLLIEFHPNKMWEGDMTALDMNVIFNKLEMAGYRLISLEPVTFRNYAQVELVFIRKDWDPSGDW